MIRAQSGPDTIDVGAIFEGGRSPGLHFPWFGGAGIAGPQVGPTGITVRVPLSGKIDVLLPGAETVSETADEQIVRADVPAGSGYVTLAHEVAQRWWGNRVQRASTRESWVHESLAESYASLLGRAAWGDEWRAQLEAEHRRLCEAAPEGVNLALTNPITRESSLHECGPYVIGGLWVERLGIDTVLGALDAIQQKHPGGTVTTEEIRATLSAMARRDVGPLASDVWVTVKDGVGRFSTPGSKAFLDPQKLLPTRGRRFDKR